MAVASIWNPPRDWATGDRLRARDLNRELGENAQFLQRRAIDVITRYPSTDWSFTSGAFAGVGASYTLKLLLQEQAHVLLTLSPGELYGSSADNVYFDWKRDGVTFLSSDSLTPDTNGLFSVRLATAGSGGRGLPYYWWDMDVPAGTHTWELYVKAATTVFNLSDCPVQLIALGL